MNRVQSLIIVMMAAGMAACGDGAVESGPQAASSRPEAGGLMAKPQSPVAIDYRIIGTPIVGQPLAIDIEVRSLMGPQPISLHYRINDSTAMQLTEAQPSQVSIAPMADDAPTVQQVRLVPLREGRLFLNVAASVETEGGTVSTVAAIPVQVGPAPRQPAGNGTITTDENDEAIHSLPADEN
jgi:hypothetical protein